MDGKQEKRWKKCPNGHVLGEIVRDRIANRGRMHTVTRLYLFRAAVAYGHEAEGEMIAVVEGNAPVLACSLCDGEAQWFMGDEAIRHLLESIEMRRKVVVE